MCGSLIPRRFKLPLDHRLALGCEVCHGSPWPTSDSKPATRGGVPMASVEVQFLRLGPGQLRAATWCRLLFRPYARASSPQRASALQPQRILETAAGTGVVTEALARGAARRGDRRHRPQPADARCRAEARDVRQGPLPSGRRARPAVRDGELRSRRLPVRRRCSTPTRCGAMPRRGACCATAAAICSRSGTALSAIR